jgi:hypothetical protein
MRIANKSTLPEVRKSLADDASERRQEVEIHLRIKIISKMEERRSTMI